MKAEKIIESLDTVENLISNIKKGIQERKDKDCDRFGTPGQNSNGNLKDKIRVARGLLMEVSNGLDYSSFRED